jgi:hypothetical protein
VPSGPTGKGGSKMKIYVSYADEDASYGNRLKLALQPAAQALGCSVWSKQNIKPGEHWQRVMGEQLRGSQMFVAVLSADFLVSDRCQAEVTGAIQRETQGLLTVVSVLLRPCSWEYSTLHRFPILPENRKAVTLWTKQDQAWVTVQAGILHLAQRRIGN